MLHVIRVMPDDDGVHYRGVSSEDVEIVTAIMQRGVAGSPAGYNSQPHDGTLGGFCYEALKNGYQVLVTDDPDSDARELSYFAQELTDREVTSGDS